MAEDTLYIAAGLFPSKEAGVSPTGDTFYITAGLPPVVEAGAGVAFFPYHVRSNREYYNTLIGR